MLLFAMNDITLITVVQIICATVVTVVGILMKQSVDKNTQVTTERANQTDQKIDEAARLAEISAKHADVAKKVGAATFVVAKEAAQKASEANDKVSALQEDSRLKMAPPHITGDCPQEVQVNNAPTGNSPGNPK